MRRGSSFLLGAALGLSAAVVTGLVAHGCGDQDTAGTGVIVGTGGGVGAGGHGGSGAAGGAVAGGGADAGGDTGPDAGDGSVDDGGDGSVDDGGNGTFITLYPDAGPLPGESACTVIEHVGIPVASRIHVPICTPVSYPTNPPSGGNHWPIWAAYRAYQETPVPHEMYVHNEEHGTIVFLYRCEGACPEVVAALSAVYDAFPPDPLCAGLGPAARLVLTPDPDLATPIAAAAWGATYTATCIDQASLMQFALDHYAQGPEDFCTDGLDIEGMGSICADAGDGG
jgi:Protein of unknown function (DUF3105)